LNDVWLDNNGQFGPGKKYIVYTNKYYSTKSQKKYVKRKMTEIAVTLHLQLAFASVTANPLSSVMDRIASISGSEHVISTMREVEISDRNLDTWWADFASGIDEYKVSITYDDTGINGIKTESPNGDDIVCKDAGYVKLLSTLGNILQEWEKVCLVT
jgi:hypothetical protein